MKKFYNSPELEIVKFTVMENLAEGDEFSKADDDYIKEQYPDGEPID